MNKIILLRLMELVAKKQYLETTDKERQKILDNGSYALAEGYETPNMRKIANINKEIKLIDINEE